MEVATGAWTTFESVFLEPTGKLRPWFLATLAIVAILAVWAWIQMWVMRDSLVVWKADAPEGAWFDPGAPGRTTMVSGSSQGGTGIGETIVEKYTEGASSRPYNNRARFNQVLGQGAFNELPSLGDFNNASAIAIGAATNRVPVLNSCSQVLTPADKHRIAMENALDNQVTKPNYVNEVAALPEGFDDPILPRAGPATGIADFTVKGLNRAVHGY